LPQREQLDLFRALPGDMAPRDSQDLMAFPFFSLAKSRRTAPIDFRSGNVTIRVEGTQEHGIATIWDADVLIWAASQIVEARDAGLRPSRWIRATPYEILRFIGRGTSLNDYQRLKAALDRLQSTTVATSIRETTGRRLHRFSWINEWKELADASGTPLGIELILPDWFYAGVLDAALVLTIDPAYFRLKGGIERWLYRLVRKHGGGRSTAGNSTSDTCTAIRQRGPLLGLRLRPARPGGAAVVARLRPRHRADAGRQHRAADLPARAARGTGITAGEPVDGLVLSGVPGIVLSGVRPSCYQEYENAGKPTTARVCVPSNLPNKKYITFSRSAPFRWTTTKRHGPAGFPARRAAP
jgi:plasmid replication initiation protein